MEKYRKTWHPTHTRTLKLGYLKVPDENIQERCVYIYLFAQFTTKLDTRLRMRGVPRIHS